MKLRKKPPDPRPDNRTSEIVVRLEAVAERMERLAAQIEAKLEATDA